ncbi:MAG TPA: GIY-YIG nuclease family protein [bacterium]|nr:GIY-YIG nuclease family protein [bacterium]
MDASAQGESLALPIAAFQSRAASAPRAPGVYLMKDGDGRILYVGKSIDIRSRLRQHAASLRAGYGERNYRWIRQVRELSWLETNSELYALLLEDQLIKAHWPAGNVRQKEYLEYAWLAFSAEALPRLQVIDARQRGQFAAVFGPFHDLYHARDMADLVQMRFRLRTCTAVRTEGCLQGEMRKCSAPCRAPAAEERYRLAVTRAADSLQKLDPFFIRYIDHSILRCNQKKEFEKAGWLHAMRHRYRALIQRQEFIENFRRHGLVIRENGRWENTFYFLNGKLIRREGGGVLSTSVEEGVLSEWQIIDRAQVIWAWLQGGRSSGAAAVIDARLVQKGWLEASPGLSPLAREE